MKNTMKLLTGMFLLASAFGVSAQEIEINIGHALSENSSCQVAGEHFAKLMDEKTNGKASIKVYPSASLGGEAFLRQIEDARNQ